MENTSILLWAISGGFAIISIGFGVTWAMILYTLKKLEKLDEKLTDIDPRLCRLEGAFSAKECCTLQHHDHRKAE
jgi:hypothetical protein